MEYTLSMTFVTTTGEKSTMSISDSKSTITKEAAFALMDKIIENDIFQTSKGNFIAKSSAQLTEKTVTKFEV